MGTSRLAFRRLVTFEWSGSLTPAHSTDRRPRPFGRKPSIELATRRLVPADRLGAAACPGRYVEPGAGDLHGCLPHHPMLSPSRSAGGGQTIGRLFSSPRHGTATLILLDLSGIRLLGQVPGGC